MIPFWDNMRQLINWSTLTVPLLPLSLVLHIDYERAPSVVQRFGNVKRLITQTLDPILTAFFRDVAQFGREAFCDSALRIGRPLLKIEVILSFPLTL